MDSRKDTLWFIGITRVLSGLMGGLWLLAEPRTILIRLRMCVPAKKRRGSTFRTRSPGNEYPG